MSGTYWSQWLIDPAKFYSEYIGVFAGQANCPISACPLVKNVPVYDRRMINWWYLYNNPWPGAPVPAATLFPLTGLSADGIGLVDGPFAMHTDGGTVGAVISPQSLGVNNGSFVTLVCQVSLEQAPVWPWRDGSALTMSIGLQHFLTDITHHDGTVSGDGALYYYLTFALMGPQTAYIQYVVRFYQDKFDPAVPALTEKNTEVLEYFGGALFSTTLGKDVYHTNIGEGTFLMVPMGYQRYAFSISREQLAAAIGFINAGLELAYEPDPKQWQMTLFALDVESAATGTNNPRIGLSWNGLAAGWQ